MKLVNSTAGLFFKTRYANRIEHFIAHPNEVQDAIFRQLMDSAKSTIWGKKYDYASIKDKKTFADRVPIGDYETHKPYITEMMHGKANVLWPGVTEWFSKSSGTTSDKSKFIPVSEINMEETHMRGPRDTLSCYYNNYENPSIFAGDYLVLGGTVSIFEPYPQTQFGDVSAIMIKNMPFFYKWFYLPSTDIALMKEWEEKIEKTARQAIEKNVVAFGGVPTWNLVLFRKILAMTGKKNLLEVWPNLELYMHGGVSFQPYRRQFQELIPSPKMKYMEVYNASEGFFACQMFPEDDDMLLLLDNGIYYEFMPMEEWEKENPKAIPLEAVELGKVYALIISTNAGLWRYQCGDTVTFTSLAPHKIKITGRTQHFINVFGEEVMVANTDKALAQTCETLGAVTGEYTAAPVFIEDVQGKGGHEWVIEFAKLPVSLEAFAELLDENLKKINSDYEAKRYKNMALNQLKINAVENGTFLKWLEASGKVGAQNKVPRLSNNRKYVEEVLAFVEKQD